ncbi:MAG: HRDC domain-containing protein [Treponema sp.]|nr:HRDC domain-containing protein [Treponema sp.]
MEKKLLDGERGTGWAFLIEYANQDGRGAAPGQPQARVDYRETLGPVEYALYDRLRAARKELADKASIPVYAVFTNDHLAAMVKKPAKTLRDLAAIPGVGDGRIKQYGQALLDVLAAASAEASSAEAASAEAASAEAADAEASSSSDARQKEQSNETAKPPF